MAEACEAAGLRAARRRDRRDARRLRRRARSTSPARSSAWSSGADLLPRADVAAGRRADRRRLQRARTPTATRCCARCSTGCRWTPPRPASTHRSATRCCAPHRSYLPVLDRCSPSGVVKALAHITGGGSAREPAPRAARRRAMPSIAARLVAGAAAVRAGARGRHRPARPTSCTARSTWASAWSWCARPTQADAVQLGLIDEPTWIASAQLRRSAARRPGDRQVRHWCTLAHERASLVAGLGQRIEPAGDHRRLRRRCDSPRSVVAVVSDRRRRRGAAAGRHSRHPRRARRSPQPASRVPTTTPASPTSSAASTRLGGARRLDAHPHDELPRLVPRHGREPPPGAARRAARHRTPSNGPSTRPSAGHAPAPA